MARIKAEASADVFSGFPQAGMEFLRELKKNNDRDWFRERKDSYLESVERPMALLVTEVAARCRKRGLTIATNERNPVMRVYRDIRFSPDKSPFKSHVGAGLRGSRAGRGEIYIHIAPEEAFVAAGFWMPERAFLRAWRESMAKEPRTFLRVVKALAKAELRLSEEGRLSRLPRGYDSFADTEIADLLRLTSYVTTRALTPKEIRSPELVDVICEFALGAKPLLEYGWGLGYEPKRDILEER